MSGAILGAGLPFLGPAVAAWITLIVGVMAFYFLSVFHQSRTGAVSDPPPWRQPQSAGPPPGNEPARAPWISQLAPAQAAPDLPAYDMENYPDEKWRSLVDVIPSRGEG